MGNFIFHHTSIYQNLWKNGFLPDERRKVKTNKHQSQTHPPYFSIQTIWDLFLQCDYKKNQAQTGV